MSGTFKHYQYHDEWTYYSLVMPYSDIDLGQFWFRLRLATSHNLNHCLFAPPSHSLNQCLLGNLGIPRIPVTWGNHQIHFISMGWIIIADVCLGISFLCDPVQFWPVTAGSLQRNEPQFQTKLGITLQRTHITDFCYSKVFVVFFWYCSILF